MNEEINEILELSRDGVKRPVVTLSKYSLDNICELNPNECKKLLEYIENLQSQLKAKEEENEQLKADYGNLAQVERDFLKEIIKEAREYIKEHIRIDDEYPAYMEMLITERDELDEILSKGENK